MPKQISDEQSFIDDVDNMMPAAQKTKLGQIIIEHDKQIDDLESGGAVKVKASVADTVADFLLNKLSAGANITLNLLNPGVNEKVEIVSSGGGSGGITTTPNVVLVAPAPAPVIAGKQYNTWAAADTYVQTQSPASPSNLWTIVITGSNSENIVFRDGITIQGLHANTILSGNLTSTNAGAPTATGAVDCVATNLTIGAGMAMYFKNGGVISGTLAAGAVFDLNNGIIAGGDFSAATVSIYNSQIYGGTFPSGTTDMICREVIIAGGTIAGGQWTRCDIRIAVPNGSYIFNTCQLANNISLSTPNGIYMVNCAFYNVNPGTPPTITITSGTLFTYGLVGAFTVNNVGGTWNNLGEAYDNTVSGLTATKVQAAIDELAAGSGGGSTPSYGEMTNITPAAFALAGSGTYKGFDASAAGLMTAVLVAFANNAAGDRLVIGVGGAGVYQVDCYITFSGTTGHTLNFAIHKNGTIQNNLICGKTTTGTGMVTVSVTGLLSMVVTDYIDVRVKCNVGNHSITLYYCNTVIKRVS